MKNELIVVEYIWNVTKKKKQITGHMRSEKKQHKIKFSIWSNAVVHCPFIVLFQRNSFFLQGILPFFLYPCLMCAGYICSGLSESVCSFFCDVMNEWIKKYIPFLFQSFEKKETQINTNTSFFLWSFCLIPYIHANLNQLYWLFMV